MSTDNQVQDVVDAIERELGIEVPKGYGVQVSPGVYSISFGDQRFTQGDWEAIVDVAYEYAPMARDISTANAYDIWSSEMTIRF
jgi:hypothetical protein